MLEVLNKLKYHSTAAFNHDGREHNVRLLQRLNGSKRTGNFLALVTLIISFVAGCSLDLFEKNETNFKFK